MGVATTAADATGTGTAASVDSCIGRLPVHVWQR